MKYNLECSMCENPIREHDKYLKIGRITICEACIYWNMEEFDPEGDIADASYEECRTQ